MTDAMMMRRLASQGRFRMDDGTFKHGENAAFVLALTMMSVENIQKSVGVDVTNIGEYIMGHEGEVIDLRSFDSAIAPWPHAWLEADLPSPGVPRVGILSTCSKVGASVFDIAEKAFAKHLTTQPPNPLLRPAEDEYLLSTMVWVWSPRYNAMVGPECSTVIILTLDGEVAQTQDGQERVGLTLFDTSGSDEYQQTMHTLGVILPLFAFQFANCRNVETIEVLPTRQQRRAAERKGEPITSHYVLAIDPNTQRKIYPKGQVVPQGKRLHIARGHFATYTEAAPLFGKLVGRFWVPAHVRGRADAGIIRKDYRIEALTS